MLVDDRTRAILAAQWRSLINYYPRGSKSAALFSVVMIGAWYALVVFFAWLIAAVIPEARNMRTLVRFLGIGAAAAMVFWQLVPLALASGGLSLQTKRLLVYPVPPHRLFGLEVMLRITTGGEPLILLAGAMIGLWRHPQVPAWAPLAFLPFVLLNLLLSAGLRDLLVRLLSRRGLREIVLLVFVFFAALPQLLASLPHETLRHYVSRLSALPYIPWPWTVTARLACGQGGWLDALFLTFWLFAGAWFGYTQFQRNLNWDADEARAKERSSTSPRASGLLEFLLRLPSRVFPDPLGGIVEKEIRFLSRASRFRIVFFMGFTFGLIIWIPVLLRGGGPGFFSENYLVIVSLYAVLLLGDVLFWNQFGFDRAAAQVYYALPVPFRLVLLAKNITAVALLLVEVGSIAAVVFLLRLPITAAKIAESFAVTLLYCLFLLAAGNLSSLSNPRPVDPSLGWRANTGGKLQGVLLLLYPLMTLPVTLAYLARYAWDSNMAFYAVLGAGYFVGLSAYWVSLGSAEEMAWSDRERIVERLSRSEGLVA